MLVRCPQGHSRRPLSPGPGRSEIDHHLHPDAIGRPHQSHRDARPLPFSGGPGCTVATSPCISKRGSVAALPRTGPDCHIWESICQPAIAHKIHGSPQGCHTANPFRFLAAFCDARFTVGDDVRASTLRRPFRRRNVVSQPRTERPAIGNQSPALGRQAQIAKMTTGQVVSLAALGRIPQRNVRITYLGDASGNATFSRWPSSRISVPSSAQRSATRRANQARSTPIARLAWS